MIRITRYEMEERRREGRSVDAVKEGRGRKGEETRDGGEGRRREGGGGG